MSEFSEDGEQQEDGDRESMTSEEAPFSNDLEKSNAVVAAFTVVGIFSLFFIEIGLVVVFMVIITNGDQLNERIAHSELVIRNLEAGHYETFAELCSGFPQWRMIENTTLSFCDPRKLNISLNILILLAILFSGFSSKNSSLVILK